MHSFHPPESLEVLKARYHRALEHVYDIESVVLGLAESPVVRPECTFETEDGICIIVSREDVGGPHPDLHVSATFRADSAVGRRFARDLRRAGSRIAMGRFAIKALARYREISGDDAAFSHLEWSAILGLPHWRRTEF